MRQRVHLVGLATKAENSTAESYGLVPAFHLKRAESKTYPSLSISHRRQNKLSRLPLDWLRRTNKELSWLVQHLLDIISGQEPMIVTLVQKTLVHHY
ncbi:hypothetical protein B9Z55_002911 [Caenorhabditis nigoni]|uniref:Uncharacterized protein n=1 Tax=Caenorhabditis nigoni TaxID=1611254 RepID=A0A2G5VML2_9PELO|nr:hypothetical protein B9Z55_002911 [Caenorhabditis nigoni]